MQRIPEPELMNDTEQAIAYARADFAIPHQFFIELFQEKFPDLTISGEVLDLGCGPCDITRRFVQAYPEAILHGVDGAAAMLAQAESMNQQAGVTDRIQLVESCLPNVNLPQQYYHLIISNSLLHHLHDPFVLWDTLHQHTKPFANVFIMDLMRPETEQDAKKMVSKYASDEPKVLQDDFFHSLCAAFLPEEVRKQLLDAALPNLQLEVVSDRHMIIYGTL